LSAASKRDEPSGKPLAEKLGARVGMRVLLAHALEGYRQRLAGIQEAGQGDSELPFAQAFYRERAALENELPGLARALARNGMLWLCWPKRASGVQTDLNENIVREIGLAAGLVDIKIVSIDETWSGLKFVYRLADR
jgi:hypothetical protein